MDNNLQSWVMRAQAGEIDAYEQIVQRFQDMAYRYAYAIVGDFHLAQDAAQESFIEAYQCLPNLREPLAFPGWFKRIVFKHCDRLTRGKQAAVAPLDAVGDLVADVPGPAEMAERDETTASVLQAVRSLPENERQAIALYFGGGYDQNEIAAFLDVPVSTIKSRLYAARKRLRERMLEMIQEALRRGEPAPPEVLQAIADKGLAYLDDYGMEGWYLVAREAAAAGDPQKAFDALERAVGYWSNGPLYFDRVWEQDTYWGELRQHPEYRRIFEEKRQRIGPIYGQLHYFPGW